MIICDVARDPIIKLRMHGLMLKRRNSIANALELRLSCINPFDLII